MREKFRFRMAEAKDFDFLLASIRRYFEFDGIHFMEDRVRSGLKLLLDRSDLGSAWLAYESEVPIGYAILGYGFDLEFGGKQATLTDLFIEPAHRGHGAGQAFLKVLEAYCVSQGLGAIELQAETDNTEALSLYEKCGFVRHTRIPMSKRL